MSRNEKLLTNIKNGETPGSFDEPQSPIEAILQNMLGANNTLREPQSRNETLLKEIYEQGGGGGSAVLIDKTITANGEYDPADDNADGYSSVAVNVPTGGADIPSGGIDLADFLAKSAGPSGGLGTLDLSGMKSWNCRPYALYKANFNKIIIPDYASGANNTVPTNFAGSSTTLEEVVIGIGFVSIAEFAFFGCINLRDVRLPATLSTIDQKAFQSCASLAIDKLPENLTSIGDSAFHFCEALAIDELPTTNNLTLRADAFANSGIRIKEIPANINMGSYASVFSGCSNLTDLKIKVAKIYRSAFASCSNLTKVWIGSNCTSIDASTYASWGPFYGCTALTDIYCEAESQPAGWGTYWNYTAASTQATAHFGVSEEDFDSIVGG